MRAASMGDFSRRPEPKRILRAYRFTPETIEMLEELADTLHLSRTAVIERAVADLLRRNPV